MKRYLEDDLACELRLDEFDSRHVQMSSDPLDVLVAELDVLRLAAVGAASAIDDLKRLLVYLDADDEDGPYKARQKPCPFLGEDDCCKIYDVWPTVCREYPHTDKEGFTFRTMGVANNTLVCPAVFWIVEQMKRRALG